MEDPRFVINGMEREQAKEELRKAIDKTSLNNDEFLFLIEVLQLGTDPKNLVVWTSNEEGQPALRGRIGGGYLHLNVKNTALVTAALLLDAIITRGLAVGALAMAGRNLQCFANLSPKTGAFCNILTLEKIKKTDFPVPTNNVLTATATKDCPHSQIGCQHLKEGQCGITFEYVKKNLEHMAAQGILSLSLDGTVEALH